VITIGIDNMNPCRITNITLACLVLWRIVLALYNVPTKGLEITGDKLIVFLIGAGIFYGGMFTIAEYFTGQKTITCWSTYSSVQFNRYNPLAILQLFFSLLLAPVAVAVIMTL